MASVMDNKIVFEGCVGAAGARDGEEEARHKLREFTEEFATTSPKKQCLLSLRNIQECLAVAFFVEPNRSPVGRRAPNNAETQ